MNELRNVAKCVLIGAMLFAITGCSEQTKLSPDEAAHIVGHAPPPEAQKIIAEQKAKAAARMMSDQHAPATGGAPAGGQ
jgi:hypothetical protein